MISDLERREIAARLRFTDHNMTWSEGCFCIADDVGAAPTGNEHDDVLAFAHALSDLIDRPTCENINEHYDVFECSECHCKVEVMGECRSEYGGIFHAPFIPSYCPSCGAEAV